MKVSSSVALAASSVLALGSIAPAFAHESRILPATPGQIRLVVGFHVEPAWEDSFNAVDVILSTFDGTCPTPNANVNIGKPIDTGGTGSTDTVDLKVAALYLKKAVPPGGATGSIAPAGIIAHLTITFFVCGLSGTLFPGHSFHCVEAIQPFPGEADDGYEASSAPTNHGF